MTPVWKLRDAAAVALLTALVAGVFSPVAYHQWLFYDDDAYVTGNLHVRTGLTWENARWALSATAAANWHPVTWWSHQLDATLWGNGPRGPHLVNVTLHATAAVLLFAALRTATGAFWPALLAAALFAVHPLRVESVAWAAQRKDVLSLALGLAAVWRYVARAKRGQAPVGWSVVALFAAAVAAKPTLVTLPPLLWILHLWPLGRSIQPPPVDGAPRGLSRLDALREGALWLIAFSAASLTFWAQASAHAMTGAPALTWRLRIETAIISAAVYLEKFCWPCDLIFLYPQQMTSPPPGQLAAAAAVLAAITIVCLWQARRRPYLLAGWLWNLVALAPMSGLVRVGLQSMADRYTYLPQIGVAVAVCWLAADVAQRVPRLRPLLAIAAVAWVAALAVACRQQVGVWRNTHTLTDHAIAIQPDNHVAWSLRGYALEAEGRAADALDNYRRAVELSPDFAEARVLLAQALLRSGAAEGALGHATAALRVKPSLAAGYAAQAQAFSQLRQWRPAAGAVVQAWMWAGGNEAAARETLQRLGVPVQTAVEGAESPASQQLAAILGTWAQTLASEGAGQDAEFVYWEALSVAPLAGNLDNDLAWLLATSRDPQIRNPEKAVQLAETALQSAARPEYLDTLAAAQAAAGRFDEAVQSAERALALASGRGASAPAGSPPDPAAAQLIEGLQARLELYRQGRAYVAPH